MSERSNAEKVRPGRIGLAMEAVMIAMGVSLVSGAAIVVAFLLVS